MIHNNHGRACSHCMRRDTCPIMPIPQKTDKIYSYIHGLLFPPKEVLKNLIIY